MADDFIEGVGEVLVGAGVAGFLWGLGRALAPLRCPKCAFSLRGMRRIARFCPKCGTKLLEGGYCEKCRISYSPEFKFCPLHGTALQPRAEPPERPSEGLSERVLEELKKQAQGLPLAQLANSLGIRPGKEFQKLSGTISWLLRQGKLRRRRGKYLAA